MMTCLVTCQSGRQYLVEFNMDEPLMRFHHDMLPQEIVSCEILEVRL